MSLLAAISVLIAAAVFCFAVLLVLAAGWESFRGALGRMFQ